MLARSKARTTGVVPGHRRQPGAGSVSRLRGFDAPPQLTTTGPSRTGTTRSGGRAPASTRAARPTGADGCPRVPPCTSDRRNWRGNPESPVASAYALESIVLEGFEGGHRRTEGAHKLHVTIQNLLGTVVGRPSRSGETEAGGWHPRWFGGRLGGATGSVRGGDQQGQRSRTGAVSGSMATPLHLVGPSDWCPLVGGRKSGGQVAPDAVGGRIPWFGGRGRTTAGRADRDRPGRRPSRNPTLEARATPAGLEYPRGRETGFGRARSFHIAACGVASTPVRARDRQLSSSRRTARKRRQCRPVNRPERAELLLGRPSCRRRCRRAARGR